jgi:Mg-chelatase subunit ChlD
MMLKKITINFCLSLFLLASIACEPNQNNANASNNKQANAAIPANAYSANTAANDVPRVLNAQWYQDADGNAVPDFVETELGYNPAIDDCDPLIKCGDGASGNDLEKRPQNILLMLDSSGSMRASAGGGKTKIAAAKDSLNSYVSKAPEKIRFGFLVYGHKGSNQESGKAESCAGIDVLAALGDIGKQNIKEVLNRFEPVGYTPIGASLEKARETFANQENADNRIILVSDGIETCGGDPVAAAKKLKEEGFRVTVDVVGFDVSSNDAAQLRKIAEAGGGTYTDAKSASDLDKYFETQGAAFKKNLKDSNCFFDAALESSVCETKLLNAALDKINQTMMSENLKPFGETEEKYKAFDELKKRIRTSSEERRARNQETKRRAEDLRRQGFEINRQTIENYDRQER